MNKFSIWILAMVLVSPVWAGTATVLATGKAFVPAEYIALSVAVHSKCYKRSQQAAEGNAKMANEILGVLDRYVTEAAREKLQDPLTAVGGYFARQTETIYRGSQTVVLCENGWRTVKHISLKLIDVEKVAEVQDAILDIVDKTPEVKDLGEPQTWADFSNPAPGLTPEAERALADEALKTAIGNARAEMASIIGECGLKGARLTDIRAPGQSNVPALGFHGEKAVADSGAGSPFLFGQMTATVTRLFTFTYDKSISCRH